jgi:hypothetical protein
MIAHLALPKRVYLIALAAVSLISLMLYVQGSFLTLGMTSVEGDGVGNATVSTLKLIINIVIWSVVIGGGIATVVIFSEKHGDIISTVLTVAMLTVIIMQTVSCRSSSDPEAASI